MDEWWAEIGTDILGSLGGNGAMTQPEFGLQLGISEAATTSILSTLAQEREGSYSLDEFRRGRGATQVPVQP